MTKDCTAAFLSALRGLGEEAQQLTARVSEQEMALAGELRLRVGAPAVLSLPDGLRTIGTSAITRRQMDNMVISLCGHSVYTHQHEIASGFIALPGGHRAGVCGRAVTDGGEVKAVRDISSICLRIAREYSGCARVLTEALFGGGMCSAVIAGAPASGKTTLLRDAACILAGSRRVAVVDERGELAISGGKVSALCDVLSGYPKAAGIMTALRCLSPDVIICDELGGESDLRAVEEGINAGVHIVCSIHAGSAGELAGRPQTAALLRTGGFRKFAVLRGREHPGETDCILDSEEVYALACSGNDNALLMADGRDSVGQTAEKKAAS